MGLDGGTLPTRSDILRRSSWQLIQRDKSKSTRGGVVDVTSAPREQSMAQRHELARLRWSACALSGEPLREPIVACAMGHVYNRDSVVEYLCGTQRFESTRKRDSSDSNGGGVFAHIRSLRDVFAVKLVPNPAFVAAETGADGKIVARDSGDGASDAAPFVCPVTGLESNGVHQFITIPECGHCFAEKSLVGLTDAQTNKPTKSLSTSTSTTTSTSSKPTASAAAQTPVTTTTASSPQQQQPTGISKEQDVCPLCGIVYTKSMWVMLNPINVEYAEMNKKRYQTIQLQQKDRKRKSKHSKAKKPEDATTGTESTPSSTAEQSTTTTSTSQEPEGTKTKRPRTKSNTEEATTNKPKPLPTPTLPSASSSSS